MRGFLLLLFALTSCAGFSPLGNVRHSEFFSQYRYMHVLNAEIARLGTTVQGGGSGGSVGGDRGENSFGFQFPGDETMRSSLMSNFQAEVEREIRESNLDIHGRGAWGGSLDGFSFRYSGGEVEGQIRVYSALTAKGIEIRGFVEERRRA